MQTGKLALSTIIAAGLLLSACSAAPAGKPQAESVKPEAAKPAAEASKTGGSQEISPADFAKVYKELVAQLGKGADGKVDWDQAISLYNQVKPLVQKRDAESNDQVNNQLEAAMKGGKDGTLNALVVAQLHDKLLQKVTFFSVRRDLKDANDQFMNKEQAKAKIKEAKEFYNGVLKSMLEKRDKAYTTQLVTNVDSGFIAMEQAIDKGDNLAYNLGRQVVDKTIMKAFYLVSGAEKGYGYRIEQLVKEGSKNDLKVPQAEGWAFFQSLKAYLAGADQEAADYINKQFDLSNDAKNIKGDPINQAYVRAFAATAKSEYKATFESWGQDKSAITAMEGALFIDVIQGDLPKALGAEKAKALADNAQKLLNEVKAGNKEKAEQLYQSIEADLNQLAKYGK